MDNAAERKSFASTIYEEGVKNTKLQILNSLPNKFTQMHVDGDIHIHDLEGFYFVNNCCTPRLKEYFKRHPLNSCDDFGKILETFEKIKILITNIANCQTGGIGFGNIDLDLEELFINNTIEYNDLNIKVLHEVVYGFIVWMNEVRARFCRENYYVTINFGLAVNEWGREITKAFLEKFMKSKSNYVKPNLVFKVHNKINSIKGTINYDLYLLAQTCTAKRMIPTYLLCDSDTNKNCIPEDLNIMGCRTRVYDNINGKTGSIGRGNIAYVSINLPRLALKTRSYDEFKMSLRDIIDDCYALLMFRKDALINGVGEHQKYIFDECLWQDVTSINEMTRQGTFSIGFIGLTETVEVLTGKKYFEDKDLVDLGLDIVKYMRSCIDSLRKKHNINLSLLATSGEMISGRFSQLDSKLYPHVIQNKGFYTNSFHVNVDSQLSIMDKLCIEGPFHNYCNGGSICYLEFASALLSNIEAIDDVLKYAEKNSVSYIGFNYPLDICEKCGYTGTYDRCPVCDSNDVCRIRRVSGYLEDVSYFTSGKKQEVKYRKANK